MRPCTISILIALITFAFPATGQGTQRDYDRAAQLRAQFSGKVQNTNIPVTWSPAGDALYFTEQDTGARSVLQRVDLKTGILAPALDPERLRDALGEDDAAVWRITPGENGGLWALAWADGAPAVLRAAGELVVRQPLDSEHPFHARQVDATRSRDGGGNARLAFANNLDSEVSLHWLDRDGNAVAYGTLAPKASTSQNTFDGHLWSIRDAAGEEVQRFVVGGEDSIAVINGQQQREDQPERRGNRNRGRGGASQSPDGSLSVVVANNNIRIRGGESEVDLTTDGTEANAYSGPLLWSPDGTRLFAMREEAGQEHTVSFVESSPGDQLQPKLHQFNYNKPGDRIDHPRPVLFDVEAAQQIPIDDSLFPTPWSIGRVHWAPDGARVYFVYNQRGHQVLRLLAINAKTGEVSVVIEDQSETFIDYSQKLYVQHLDDTDEVLWASERDGWNHLFLFDRSSGALKRQVTQGDWVLRGVEEIDEEARTALIEIMGYYPDQDPYYIHFARVSLDTGTMTLLTHDNGTHDIEFSPDGAHFVDTWSRTDLPPVTQLRRSADGSLVRELGRGNATELIAADWHAPEPFRAKGRDGKTDIYGLIYRPTTFDPAHSYPVVELIYAGPHGQHVPKEFAAYRNVQSLAELGFIAVQIDGMGTNWRSKAFHDVCWKNLADAGFPDRIAWMRAATAQYPYMDLSRVGIYGGSAGGQNAMRALIDHGDFYDAAVADCGCHDNRMDKIWWNEAWMGWPVDEAANDRSSNAVQAHKMQGHLLLTVGELDRNVDPASTMQVVDKLIEADKDFELIVFPGAGHGAGGSPYGVRRRNDFFVRHLLGVAPRHSSTTSQ